MKWPNGIKSGFNLAFGGLFFLWIGTPFLLQFIYSLSFVFIAYKKVFTAPEKNLSVLHEATKSCWPILAGAFPVACLFTQFETPQGSHLESSLVAASWGLATIIGAVIGAIKKSR